jgi:hypothetical protein
MNREPSAPLRPVPTPDDRRRRLASVVGRLEAARRERLAAERAAAPPPPGWEPSAPPPEPIYSRIRGTPTCRHRPAGRRRDADDRHLRRDRLPGHSLRRRTERPSLPVDPAERSQHLVSGRRPAGRRRDGSRASGAVRRVLRGRTAPGTAPIPKNSRPSRWASTTTRWTRPPGASTSWPRRSSGSSIRARGRARCPPDAHSRPEGTGSGPGNGEG